MEAMAKDLQGVESKGTHICESSASESRVKDFVLLSHKSLGETLTNCRDAWPCAQTSGKYFTPRGPGIWRKCA